MNQPLTHMPICPYAIHESAYKTRLKHKIKGGGVVIAIFSADKDCLLWHIFVILYFPHRLLVWVVIIYHILRLQPPMPEKKADSDVNMDATGDKNQKKKQHSTMPSTEDVLWHACVIWHQNPEKW